MTLGCSGRCRRPFVVSMSKHEPPFTFDCGAVRLLRSNGGKALGRTGKVLVLNGRPRATREAVRAERVEA
jgi:hypothetical protein